MMFNRILFEKAEDVPEKVALEAPDFFADLNLDQIVDAITAGKEEYNLKPFFYTSLRSIDAIQYRQEIMRDLESKCLLENVRSFARQMRSMREHLAQARKLHCRYQKQSWFLDAVQIYCDTIACLVHDLSLAELKSTGLVTFREHLINYAESGRFKALLAETKKLQIDLAAVKYCVLIKGSGIKVRKYDSEVDYSETVEATFRKFKQGAVKNYEVKFPNRPDMNHIEEKVLDFVARLYPDLFLELTNYCANNGDFLDPSIGAFDREIQFYVSYLDYVSRFKHAGLKFCYPKLLDQDKEIFSYEGFDLALAQKLLADRSPLVSNDFYLKDEERIFVVTGPNQGGKTTFARAFGQLHHLASIGCPVPGRQSQLYLFDRIFTHFEKEESIQNRRGKLEDDLVRVHDILRQMSLTQHYHHERKLYLHHIEGRDLFEQNDSGRAAAIGFAVCLRNVHR